MKADILDITGKKLEQINLSDKVFGVSANPALVAQAVRVFLANQREGNASTKTRGEVQGSSKKIYRQKGTGRARQGTIRAPHRVHGGIALGPRPHDFSLKMSQKMKKKALFSLVSEKLREKKIVFVDGLEKLKGKTKEAVKVLENLKLSGKILFILPEKKEKLEIALRNIKNISYEKVNLINIYQIADSDKIVFLKEAVEKFK